MFEENQIVKFVTNWQGDTMYPGYGRRFIPKGTSGVVVKVLSTRVHVLIEDEKAASGIQDRKFSVPIRQNSIIEVDRNATPRRRLGTPPEGMISPDDPRLDWFWEDAGKYATRAKYCAQYDKICEALNIPGRVRSFTISRTINGFKVSRSYEARSKKLAEEMFDNDFGKVNN